MNSNFNRQFLLLDFALLDDAEFLQFTRKAAFATYLLLRRYVWRSQKPHSLGLHNIYWQERKLAASVSNRLLAEKVGITDRTRISKHLSYLESEGVIQSRRTGRENIFLLGEWLDYSELQDSSKRIEWFYLDRRFGVDTDEISDVAPAANSDVPKHETADVALDANSDLPKHHVSDVVSNTNSDVPSWPVPPSQTWLKTPNNNREENMKANVNVALKKSPLNQLPETGIETAHADLIVDDLLAALGDRQSARFYRLVARKVPEAIIRQALGEVRQSDGVTNPAALFNHKLGKYAEQRLQQLNKSRLDDLKRSIG